VHAELPPIGSANVAIADPDIPPPPTDPCIVPLFDEFTFIGFDAQTFDYAPPADCPGPWQKVVLRVDFDVTAGRQFDRTAEIWLGGANIYFGTTQEPRATVAPSWHVERDVTDYSVLFAAMHAGRVDLGNVVNGTYTGIIHGSASLAFYPRVDTLADQPPRPDVVRPLAADATGGTVDLASFDDRLAITFALPTNIRRVFLDVIAQSQGDDEFWYTCVPDDYADELQSCPGTGFRETEVTIDGILAGVAPIYPWIYTGGIDPYLWRPSPGIQTLSFEPFRVDLTPYAAWLSSGQPHQIAVQVFNARNHFSTTANLLLYLDHGATRVTGSLTTNTLTLPQPDVQTVTSTGGAGSLSAIASVSSTRNYEIAGYVDTSTGRVTTDIVHDSFFSNALIFNIVGSDYQEMLQQDTYFNTDITVDTGAHKHVLTERLHWPLFMNYDFNTAADGYVQTTTIRQGLEREVDVGIDGFEPRHASLQRNVTTSDTLFFDPDFNVTGNSDQTSQQSFAYLDPFGTCYYRGIATANGILTAVLDGMDCPNDTNALTWFDAFYNAGSSIFGATVKILP
jgi:hypothetical protein